MPLAMDIPRVPEAAIVIDGRAEEAAWEEALEIKGFTVYRPKPDTEPEADTTVRILSDERHLLVHFRASDPEPQRIRKGYGRRDSRRRDDYVGMLLDPAGDGERGALFIVNPVGIQIDGTLVRGGDSELVPWRGSWDSWDARWQSAGQLTEDGYSVEIAIPWSSIRHPLTVETVGALFFRRVGRTGEMSAWPRLDPEVQGVIGQAQLLGGPGELPPSERVSVIPELTYSTSESGPISDRLGWQGIAPGATLRYAPEPAVQFLATVNPDFSQVESDEAKIAVNQRFSLQYEEKRPFFLEGQEWFSHPVEDLIYTRTMVTPLTGVRATVERDGWAVATMNLVARQPSASINEGDGWTTDEIGEREAVQSIGRIRRSVGSDGMVGAIFSDRRILGSALEHQMFGIDGRAPAGERVVLQGAALASHTTGLGEEAVFAPAAIASAKYQSSHFDSKITGTWLSPGFRSENGFLPYSDRIAVKEKTEFTLYPNWEAIPRVFLEPTEGEVAWTQAGVLRDRVWDPGVGIWLANGGFMMARFESNGERFEDVWLESKRAKFISATPWNQWLHTWFIASTGEAPLYDPENPRIGVAHRAHTQVTVQPIPAILFRPQITWERFELGDRVEYEGFIGRVQMELYATPELWSRVVLEQSTFDERKTIETLFAWAHAPGQAAYLGGHRSTTPNDALGTEWQIFAKLSWVFAS